MLYGLFGVVPKYLIGCAKFNAILTGSHTSREHALAEAWQLAEVIEPPPLAIPVSRDPDDDAVLALALAAQVDLIVSGDGDLLALTHFQGIPIATPAQAIQRIEAGCKTTPVSRRASLSYWWCVPDYSGATA